MIKAIDILRENECRICDNNAVFNPVTGEGSIGDRVLLRITDFPLPVQYIPKEMADTPIVRQIVRAGGIENFLRKKKSDNLIADMSMVVELLVRLRNLHDFPFWAATLVTIKAKGGGGDVKFVINRPQRKLISFLEEKRRSGQPIRLILLKARQWGGSTAIQLYMAWLQLVHKVGLNSLIVGHVKDASNEVKDMFDKMMSEYPMSMLYPPGESFDNKAPKMEGVGNSSNIHRIPQRNFKIKIGTAEKPDSARGGDYNLVHCTEVGLWKKTDGKTPAQIIRSACSGILLRPYTMIVYESTANGTGNFFQREYDEAKKGNSQFDSLFVAWYEIDQYELPFRSERERSDFAENLIANRENKNIMNDREEPGAYLWKLWTMGATLEAINWYINERCKYSDHGDMASEFPSDDVEAFTHSGKRVFDMYNVKALEKTCSSPLFIGDVYGDSEEGEKALCNLQFREDHQGLLWIWSKPEIDEEEEITERYLVVVDVGGRSNKADYSVIVVIDRLYMMDGDKPCVVAQWYGHIDHDLLAWKAAQVAAYYDNALLVVESNTLETKDKDRDVDGDQSSYILNQIKEVYDNLYERKQTPDEIAEGAPKKYGFHTNISTKPMIISGLVKAIREGLYVERDVRCIDEYITYEKKPNGSYGAIIGKHDDLLMTRAIGLHICFYEMGLPTVVKRQIGRIGKAKKSVGAASI